MKFVYTGTRHDTGASDGNEAGTIVAFGVTFPKGIPVEVTDAHAVHKLSGNAYFRTVAEEPATVTLPASEDASVPEPAKSEPENALLAAVPRKRSKKAVDAVKD
jgi:hypothetical protein